MRFKNIQHVSVRKSTQELISANLRFNRIIRGLSQESVAMAVSISRSKYNRIEKGRTCPDIITLCSLLTFYDISLEQLLSMPLAHDFFVKEPSEKNIDKSNCSRHRANRHDSA